MRVEKKWPEKISGTLLDQHLAEGRFRCRQAIFSCDIQFFNGQIYSVHWLRLSIPKLNLSQESRRLLHKNRHFTCVIKPFHISDEIENLYKLYRSSVDFETADSATEYLLNGSDQNRFNTRVFEIRDAGKLIAAGYADMGRKSMAAILNIYHPDYKKTSPGKFVMLMEIEYAVKTGLAWFYPGYIVKGYSKFDYKLFPDRLAFEIYDNPNKNWIPLQWPLPDTGPIFPEIADLIG